MMIGVERAFATREGCCCSVRRAKELQRSEACCLCEDRTGGACCGATRCSRPRTRRPGSEESMASDDFPRTILLSSRGEPWVNPVVADPLVNPVVKIKPGWCVHAAIGVHKRCPQDPPPQD